MAEAQEPSKLYRGNCHCGAYVYEITLPEIKSVMECNCSICTKKGYLWLYTPNDHDFKVVKGSEEDLTVYTFGPGKLQHKFCPHCGTALKGARQGAPVSSPFGLNAHAIQGLDTWPLERKPFDGAAMGSQYEAPSYSGGSPILLKDTDKVYTGGCHCGAVQLALASNPIDGTFSEAVGECNCSICERNAYIWVWPRREHVALHGNPEDIGRYAFNAPWLNKTFCKKCGVQLTNEPALQSEEAIAAMSEGYRKLYDTVKPIHPVNIRVLEGVDLATLKDKIERIRAGPRPPLYQNP